jgi:hypothetical protein
MHALYPFATCVQRMGSNFWAEREGLFHDPGWGGFRSTNHETPLRFAFFIFHKFLNQACGLLRNFFKMKNPNYRWDLMIC